MPDSTPSNQLPKRAYTKKVLPATGRLLKELRKASGYSQEQVREVLGFKVASAVSRFEQGDFRPDIHRLKRLLNMLKPNQEQQAEILEFFGYTPDDLAGHEVRRVVRHHAEQHVILNQFYLLFDLMVYQKDYVTALDQLEAFRNQELNLPASVDAIKMECQILINGLYMCRKLLAQGLHDSRISDIENSSQQAESLCQHFDLIKLRIETLDFEPTAKAFVYQLGLHIQLSLHSSLYKRLNYAIRNQSHTSEIDALFKKITDLAPTMNQLLEQLNTVLPNEDMHEVYRIHLFMQREAVHLQTLECDRQDLLAFEERMQLWKYDHKYKLSHFLKTFEQKPKLFYQQAQLLFDEIYAPSSKHTEKWRKAMGQYRQVLKEHQFLPNWDGESPEVMRAIVNTLLGFGSALGRVYQYESACLFLDSLYLRLNNYQTHFHWHSTYALVEGFRYLELSEFKLSTDLNKCIYECLEQFAYHLTKSLNYLAQNPDKEDYKKYTFLEEPIFYLILLDSFSYSKVNLPQTLLVLQQEMLTVLEENTNGKEGIP